MAKSPILVDIETDARPPFDGELLLVGFVIPDETPVQVWSPFALDEDTPGYLPQSEVDILTEALADPLRPVITMTKYDCRYLGLQGWDIQGVRWDLQVMAWTLNENQPLNLDSLSQRYMGRAMDKRIKRSGGVVYFRTDEGELVPLTEIRHHPCWYQFVDYCYRDVDSEADLFEVLMAKLASTTWQDYFLEEEAPFTAVLEGMERSGLPVNLEDSEELRAELEVRHTELIAEMLSAGGLPDAFNLNSGDQLAAYLYFPVMELAADLELGEWACGALKSCLNDEHEDCENQWTIEPMDEGGGGGPDQPVHYPRHVKDLMPDHFEVRKVGRTIVHGVYTLRGRGLPPTVKTKSGKRWATSSNELKGNLVAVQDPWVQLLFEYSRIDKALTTYLRKYPVLAHEGRLYGRFNQTGTKTGRLSSSEPNMQNQPSHGPLGERMRRLFQGPLIVGDYGQLEPRLMAHFSEDPILLDVYRNDRDIYKVTAANIFGTAYDDVASFERGICKVLVLAMGYGAGDKKVAQILTINGYPTDVATAAGYLAELRGVYHRFFAWREDVILRVKARGYVQTIGGRHRRLRAAFVDRRNWKNVGYGERQAVNAIVQGSAGDIVRRTMMRWCDNLDSDAVNNMRLLAQVHDELVWDHTLDPDQHAYVLGQLQDTAEVGHGYSLRVPLAFEPHFGDSWFAAKEGEVELPEDMLVEESIEFAEEAS